MMNHFIASLVAILALSGFAFARNVNHEVSSRIDGGSKVSPHEMPFQAAVIIDEDSVCSAILISEKWILTTSWCNVEAKSEIIFGSDKWCNIADDESIHPDYDSGYTKIAVKKTVKHREDTNSTAGPALVLAELETPVTLTSTIQLAKLAPELPKEGDMLEVSGWGAIKTEWFNCDLLKVSLPKLSDEECQEAWTSEYTAQENEFCAGFTSKDSPTACSWDWGSPLVKDGLVYGLVSKTEVCRQDHKKGYPPMFLHIAPYMQWIHETTTN